MEIELLSMDLWSGLSDPATRSSLLEECVVVRGSLVCLCLQNREISEAMRLTVLQTHTHD